MTAVERAKRLGWFVVPVVGPPHPFRQCDCEGVPCDCACHGFTWRHRLLLDVLRSD